MALEITVVSHGCDHTAYVVNCQRDSTHTTSSPTAVRGADRDRRPAARRSARPGALTMRAVGSALGYEAMSLYKHVANKQELLDLVVDRVAAELEPPDASAPRGRIGYDTSPASGGAWRSPTRTCSSCWRPGRHRRRHRSCPFIDAHARRAARGHRRRRAGHQLLLDVPRLTRRAPSSPSARRRSVATSPPLSPATVDPEGFPHLAALGSALAAVDFASGYERSIEILIASVRVHALLRHLAPVICSPRAMVQSPCER